MGYSLNQRGLFADVVRSTGDRSVKTNAGESRPCSRTSGPPLVVPQKTPISGEVGFSREQSLGPLMAWARICVLWLRYEKGQRLLIDVDAPTACQVIETDSWLYWGA
jgi:hypothetical protein